MPCSRRSGRKESRSIRAAKTTTTADSPGSWTRRANSAAQQFFADGAAYLVHPQRPGVFREAEEMPRAMIVGAGEVVDAEQHQARGPARCIERRGAGQGEVGDVF